MTAVSKSTFKQTLILKLDTASIKPCGCPIRLLEGQCPVEFSSNQLQHTCIDTLLVNLKTLDSWFRVFKLSWNRVGHPYQANFVYFGCLSQLPRLWINISSGAVWDILESERFSEAMGQPFKWPTPWSVPWYWGADWYTHCKITVPANRDLLNIMIKEFCDLVQDWRQGL